MSEKDNWHGTIVTNHLPLNNRIRHLCVTDGRGSSAGLLGFTDLIAGAEHR